MNGVGETAALDGLSEMTHVLSQKVVDAEESTAQRQREEEEQVAGGFPEAVSHATDASLDVLPDVLLVSVFGHVLDSRPGVLILRISEVCTAWKINLRDNGLLWPAIAPAPVSSHPGILGTLPLHLASMNRASLAVVQALLTAYPEAAKRKDDNWRLPLHYAIEHQASEVVVEAILAAYPKAVEAQDHDSMHLLHWAAQGKASAAVVKLLLAAYPEAVKKKDAGSRLPLHYAAKQSASVAVVEALLAAYPEAAQKKDADLRLPLHWAATCVAPSKAIVKALLDAYPTAAGTAGDGQHTDNGARPAGGPETRL